MSRESKDALDLAQIRRSLLAGVLDRASFVSFSLAISFVLYGLSSFEFIQRFDQTISLYHNVLLRIVANGIPLFLLGLYFRSKKGSQEFKVILWTIAIPINLVLASTIYVWPIMWAGKTEIYHFVHAVNVIIFAVVLSYVALPLPYMIAQLSMIIAFFLLPIGWMLANGGDELIFKNYVGDWAIILPAVTFISTVAARTRYQLAKLDHAIKKDTATFLGKAAVKAIFEQNHELISGKKDGAVIIKMDIRGFSKFQRESEEKVVGQFMTGYHSLTAKHVSKFGGFWHKSDGDSQLCTFGAMDDIPDLSDIGLDKDEERDAKMKLIYHRFQNALEATKLILKEFEEIKIQNGVTSELALGVSIVVGEVDLHIQGDGEHRKQLDISGRILTISARLEEYTKVIRKVLNLSTSVVVISPDLKIFDLKNEFFLWKIDRADLHIRDCPEFTEIYYSPNLVGGIKGSSRFESAA